MVMGTSSDDDTSVSYVQPVSLVENSKLALTAEREQVSVGLTLRY